MKFEICLGQSRKALILEDPSGKLTCEDVLLMVAKEYGEEWYGCCVNCKEKDAWICNAVKEYWTEEDPSISVYQHAINNYMGHIRIPAGLFEKHYDWRDESEVYSYGYNPFEEGK